MWNITSSELELAREELKGRRAAVEARYAKDLQGLDDDLAETLERAAAAFALKHKTEAEQGTATTEAEAESKTASEMPAVAAHATDRAGRPAEASRWRLSLGDRSSTTQV